MNKIWYFVGVVGVGGEPLNTIIFKTCGHNIAVARMV